MSLAAGIAEHRSQASLRSRGPPPWEHTRIGTALGLGAVVLLIVATAFFVAAEFAAVAVDRNRLESLAERHGRAARAARAALGVQRRLSFHLSGAQLGLTLVSLGLGVIAEPTLATALRGPLEHVVSPSGAEALSVALALALATVASMLVGELIPKKLVLARPTRAALLLATPLHLFSVALGPFVKVANGTANALVRLLGIEPREELASARSLEELAILIRSSADEGALEATQATLLARSLRFGQKEAADVLVPRLAVTAVPATATALELMATAAATGFSRFPVVAADAVPSTGPGGDAGPPSAVDLDDVVGVVHVKDVYRHPFDERGGVLVADLMAEPLAVPETRPLQDLLGDLRGARAHLAIVVDEYGGTTGIVTLEDVLEELVGEIDDEYDAPTTDALRLPTGSSWVLAGTMHPDDVADACGFVVPEGPYDTVAGFVIDRLGHLPAVGERVEADGWTFEVATVDRHRLATVRVTAPAGHEVGRPDAGTSADEGER